MNYKKRFITFDEKDRVLKEEEFICSRIAKKISEEKIFVCQYRNINQKFPLAYIIDENNIVIWSSKELEKKYQVKNINITSDMTLLVYIKHDTNNSYDFFECSLEGIIISQYNLQQNGITDVYFMDKTYRNTIVISSVKDSKVIEIENNNIIFEYCPGKEILHEPRCVWVTERGTILIPDSKKHYVIEVNTYHEIVWKYGRENDPGYIGDKLMYPYMVSQLQNGNILLVEHQSNRVTELSKERGVVWQYGNNAEDEITSPRINYLNGSNYAQCWKDEVIISDSMNGRVIVVDKKTKLIKKEIGAHPCEEFILNFPRSVQVLKSGNFLIADSRNDRIVEMDEQGNVYFEYGIEMGRRVLKWPRCVLKDENDNLYYISDGYNQRFIVLNSQKQVVRIIKYIFIDKKKVYLKDPHSIINISNNQLLITDSGSNIVAIIDENCDVKWIYNIKDYAIEDPHYAMMMDENIVLIVDTNHDRILKVNYRENKIIDVIDTFNDGKYRLNKPKWIDIININEYAILDSQNNALLIVKEDEGGYKILYKSGSDICNSRWAFKKDNKYYISDFWQHIIIEVYFNDKFTS